MKSCPVCHNSLNESFVKCSVQYYSCPECKIVCCDTIPEDVIKTQNDGGADRNNLGRFKVRLSIMDTVVRYEHPRVLDFGCGNGEFVEHLRSYNYKAYGIDVSTQMQLEDCLDGEFDHIYLTEVIEHLYHPKDILVDLVRTLSHNGLMYIESSFTDIIDNPETNGYVNPEIGHCLIHSHKSINMLAESVNCDVTTINGNVLILRKL